MGTTNFPNGLTNNTAQNCLGAMPQEDPTLLHTYFNDFDNYISGDWTVTATGSTTQALANGDGGIILITNSAGNNDLVALQKKGESFIFESGKEVFFKCRFKVSDATKSALVFGLQVTDTTPLAVSDGVYFSKAAASTALAFNAYKASTGTTASAIATLADNTYITLAFYYDGVSYVNYYAGTDTLNPTFIGRIASTNVPTTQTTTVSFALSNGEAVAKTMSVDYILVSKDR